MFVSTMLSLHDLFNLKLLKVEGNHISHGGVSPVSKLENLQVLSLSKNSLGKPKRTNASGKKEPMRNLVPQISHYLQIPHMYLPSLLH